jgi:hypothetical protein
VVAANAPAFIAATGITNVLGPFSGDLADGGERLRLVNHNDRRMDEITCGDEPPWPVGPDGSGCSLAKRQPLSSSAQPGTWSASEEIGGTPGELNFPFSGGPGSPSA